MTDKICECPRCGRQHRDLLAGTPPAAISRDTIAVSGIHLFRHGGQVFVNAEIDGKWVQVIRETHDSNFGHIVETSGMRRCASLPQDE